MACTPINRSKGVARELMTFFSRYTGTWTDELELYWSSKGFYLPFPFPTRVQIHIVEIKAR